MRCEESKCMIYYMIILLLFDYLVFLYWYFLFIIVNLRILLYKKYGINYFFYFVEDSIDFGCMKGSVIVMYMMFDVCIIIIFVELF